MNTAVQRVRARKARALFNRGLIYFRRNDPGDPERATADYNAIVAMQDAPVSLRAEAYAELADGEYALGRHNQAWHFYNQALQTGDLGDEHQTYIRKRLEKLKSLGFGG